MEILESFHDGLFKVYLRTNTEFSFNKYIIVKCGDDEDAKTWEYCIYRNFEMYGMIGKFLEDLSSEIYYMDLADGIDGVFDFLDKLLDTEECPCAFLDRYY